MYRATKAVRPKAFTLLEIIVALSIFVMFSFAAYKLFMGGKEKASISMWSSQALTSLRNTFTFMKGELSASSYPSVVLEDEMADAADNPSMANDVKCCYVKKLESPASGDLKAFLAFPVSRPATKKNKGETEFKVYCLQGEAVRTKNQLAGLWVYTFKMEYELSAKGDKFAGVKFDSAAFVSKKLLLPNVKEVIIDALQSLEVKILCQMPNIPTTNKSNVGSIRPNVQITENESYLNNVAGKCKSN